jgi:hypothetical protein
MAKKEDVSNIIAWSPRQISTRERLVKDIRINWQLYAMFLLPVIYYIIFRYIPMFGNILAFRKYNPGGSIFGQGPLTLKYFKQFITAKPFWQAFRVALKRDQKPSLEEVRSDSFLSPALHLNGYRLRYVKRAPFNTWSYQ